MFQSWPRRVYLAWGCVERQHGGGKDYFSEKPSSVFLIAGSFFAVAKIAV